MSCFRIKRRLSIKYLIIIPIIYFIYFLFLSSTTNILKINNNSFDEKQQLEQKLNEINNNNNNNNLNNHNDNKHDLNDLNDLNNVENDNYVKYKSNGEYGRPLIIDDKKLSPEEKKLFDEGWSSNAFNRYASDIIPLNRTLPDVRLASCKNEIYRKTQLTASIIMCFHNEAWSVLLRSVYSIINRTPKEMLKEILLVDDFSDQEHLKSKFDNYLKLKFGNLVRVLRNTKREGLIRTRLFGAREATGDVLIFLDSHIEATIGWLEPLIDLIEQNETNVVTPMIDIIDQHTFEYKYSTNNRVSVGGFDWNLQFTWHGLPESEYKLRKTDHDPVKSPTMAGGLFAISKNYFIKLGTYDAMMDIWGGENLEISFRIWMCGGTLFTVPCSHVGHIFRDRSPYKWMPGVNVLRKNSIRVAEVWLDDYKKLYYERINYDLGQYGDVTERKELRKRLKCKSFQWYIDNIYPDLWIPSNSIYIGPIEDKQNSYCFDAYVAHSQINKPVNLHKCLHNDGNQIKSILENNKYCLGSPSVSKKANKKKPLSISHCNTNIQAIDIKLMWYYTKNNEIRRDDMCIDYAGGISGIKKENQVIIYPCHGEKGNQEWIYNHETSKSIVHKLTGLCMEMNDNNLLIMNVCNTVNDRQKWIWKTNSN